MIEEIFVNNSKVWLVLEQLYTYSSDNKFIKEEDSFICYFSLQQPNTFINGELFRDYEKHPILFKSKGLAIDYAKLELPNRLNINP